MMMPPFAKHSLDRVISPHRLRILRSLGFGHIVSIHIQIAESYRPINEAQEFH